MKRILQFVFGLIMFLIIAVLLYWINTNLIHKMTDFFMGSLCGTMSTGAVFLVGDLIDEHNSKK